MEAKDTVMTDDAIIRIITIHHEKDSVMLEAIQAIAKEQAEISFKAGYDYGHDKGYAFGIQHCYKVIIPQAKIQGMREVVDWVNEHQMDKDALEQWQSKLKEWGIE